MRPTRQNRAIGTVQVLNNIFAGKTALLSWVTGMAALTHVDIQRVDINSGELEQFAALPGLVHLGVGDLTMLLVRGRGARGAWDKGSVGKERCVRCGKAS